MDMPKMSERERLTDLEGRHRKIGEELELARRAVRDRYAAIVTDMGVEQVPERVFREIMMQVIRAGGNASLAALKTLPAVAP
jgi:hypothetical protein